jgi:hypothetical protein
MEFSRLSQAVDATLSEDLPPVVAMPRCAASEAVRTNFGFTFCQNDYRCPNFAD